MPHRECATFTWHSFPLLSHMSIDCAYVQVSMAIMTTSHITLQDSLLHKAHIENLRCMGIMQDNLCHPYTLSTTVLSDQHTSGGSCISMGVYVGQ